MGTTKVHKNCDSRVQKHSVVEKQVNGEDDVVKQRVTPDRKCEHFVNHDGEPITNQDNDYKSVETGNSVLDTAVVSKGTLGEHIKDHDHDNKSVNEMGEKGNSVGEKAVDAEDNVVKQGITSDCPCENFANGDGGASGEQITGNGFGETEWVSDGASVEQLKNCDDDDKSVDEMAETGNSLGEKESDVRKQVIVSGGTSGEQIPNLYDDNQIVDENSQTGNGVGETEGVSDGALAEPIKNRDDNKSVDETAERGNNSVAEKESDVVKQVIMYDGASVQHITNSDDDKSADEMAEMANGVCEKAVEVEGDLVKQSIMYDGKSGEQTKNCDDDNIMIG